MPCHPEAREKCDGILEHESRDMGCESDETEVEHLSAKDEVIENVIECPGQSKIEAAASRITEQFKAHHLAERRIEEVDDLGQSAFHPGFYVSKG